MTTFSDFNVAQIKQDVKVAQLIRFLTVKSQENNLEGKSVFVGD